MIESTQDYKFGTWYPIEELKALGKHVLFDCNLGLVTGAMYRVTWGMDEPEFEITYRCNTPNHLLLIPTHWMPLPLRPESEASSD